MVDVAEGKVVGSCSSKNCPFLHDLTEYLKIKPPDIASTCYVYSLRGYCPRGVACRFGSQHLTSEGNNITNKELWERYQKENPTPTINILSKDVQFSLRKKRYDFTKSEKVVEKVKGAKSTVNSKKEECDDSCVHVPDESGDSVSVTKEVNGDDKRSGSVTDEDIIRVREEEKKKIDWRDKLFLSPLTTVGNLPFRRIAKEFGADVTCGEMAMASSLLRGVSQEWALVKRHSTEDIFGIQLCGNNPYVMTRCCQLLQEQTSFDFIDINLGCPIDLVYKQGAGSGLLNRTSVLEPVVRSMSTVLEKPLTVKLRTGVYNDKNIAHLLAPKFGQWGVSLITVHGRSREQRYTRLADWPYIEQCAKMASPTPLFGNGDILSYEDYERMRRESPSVAGVMIGRGALYKPWIFTEIKERRHWDISSSERFDILKKYVNYGLEHWGSDTRGVETLRRFLLEWLSFLHRYIPVGLLEHPPQRVNERPPYYRGRDDLETLMASPNCADWIKISEMLLGPVPENFYFLPKHKASSWK
ncbi:tRNA-dihydrouridine(47) synthase [NAD(P)(+)]-like isoform X2 [Anabrus simplex]